jgi:tripartite-type tricarboxylate transporter receptor subunit TctC
MRLLSAFFAACLSIVAVTAHAQSADAASYPSRPVKIIVPFPAGGTLDNVARLVAKGLSDKWGQQVVVDNKPGGGAVIGTRMAATSAPDGYTLLFMANGFIIVPMMMQQLPYDPLKDFVPIGLIGRVNQALVAAPGFGANNLAQLIELAKKQPGKLSFASFGIGTSSHLAVELFKKEAGIDMTHVPYKGVAPALQDTLGGQVDIFFTNFPEIVGQVQSGKLKVLAVADTRRVPQLPNAPTFAEQGFPNFNVYSWFGAVAPAGTPDEVVRKINATLQAVLKELETSDRVVQQGVVMTPSTPGQLAQYMRGEQGRYAEIIKLSGAKLD